MAKLTKSTLMPLGMILILVGLTLFILYIGRSVGFAVGALLLLGTTGVVLVMKSRPEA